METYAIITPPPSPLSSTHSSTNSTDLPSFVDGNVTLDNGGVLILDIGSESEEECKICYQNLALARRSCCDYATCTDCLRQYFASQVEMGSMRIECINIQCHFPVDPEEIASLLDSKLRDIYFRLIQENNCNLLAKTCPSCSTMYTLKNSQQLRTMKKMVKKDSTSSRVKCDECQYYWCFLCHAPWHQGLTCGQYRQGDRLLKVWAKQLSQGQLNAQRCPKCKTFIQKSGGCDHMHCNRCKTGFCYRCGEPLRRLKFFGDHYSKFSIFGCKYRYKKESPIQRKAIRGAVFASKLFLAPVLGSLIFCAGTLFVSVAVAFLPFYGVVTIYKRCCC
ncbi:probable E3 ubiquitin-protein ligase RNF217 [Tetranychus urticae]|uniref:RBR-type E3 ubiquitin transferase n=1 Tax=Tetranychus urticae TaxID=32264 RepID=T1K675_TETUR|nr:probable E3 ubiquitin-protein ligase RNF217 [Tetranychus urticae]XP_015782919.1 probable E3 ubiquitin-protein ligase RNF217 [Tetranychus urticae]